MFLLDQLLLKGPGEKDSPKKGIHALLCNFTFQNCTKKSESTGHNCFGA